MVTIRPILAIAVLAVLCVADGQAQEKTIVMTHVKYDGLKQEVLKHRGKVVIVDFWRSNCGPCRKKFPYFVDLYKKHANQGLVVISVSLDPVDEDGDYVKAANKFLNDSKSPFVNLLLDETIEFNIKKFAYDSLPFYYVFDRRGKWERFRAVDYVEKVKQKKDDDVLYKELEGVVMQMLAEK